MVWRVADIEIWNNCVPFVFSKLRDKTYLSISCHSPSYFMCKNADFILLKQMLCIGFVSTVHWKVLISVRGSVDQSAAERFNDTFGNRTRDLPPCSPLPQPNAPPPPLQNTQSESKFVVRLHYFPSTALPRVSANKLGTHMHVYKDVRAICNIHFD